MKQKIGVFLLSALLVVSLSACGQMSSRSDSGILRDNTTTAERNYRQSTSPNNSTNGDNGNSYKQGNRNADNRQGVLEPRRNSINSDNSNNTNNGGNNSTGKTTNNGGGSSNQGTGAKGSNNKGGTNSRNGMGEGLFDTNGNSYEQMVRNGLVNDTDGDLTDGENPHS